MVDAKLLEKIDINDGFLMYKNTENGILLDVRHTDEFSSGHIDGSINIPLEEIEDIIKVILDFETPLFVYCRSGVRSTKATEVLYNIGYKNVKNIGGILDYKGIIVK